MTATDAELAMRMQIAEIQEVGQWQQRQSSAPRRLGRGASTHEQIGSRKAISWQCAIDMALALLVIAPLGPVAVTGCAPGAFGQLAVCCPDWRLALLHSLLSVGNVAVRGILVPITTDNFLFATASVALAIVSVHQAALGLRYTSLLWCA